MEGWLFSNLSFSDYLIFFELLLINTSLTCLIFQLLVWIINNFFNFKAFLCILMKSHFTVFFIKKFEKLTIEKI